MAGKLQKADTPEANRPSNQVIERVRDL